MIRHFATGLGTLAALTTAVLAVPAAAQAAYGPVLINGHAYIDPNGCNAIQEQAPLNVANFTSGTVVVFEMPQCNGFPEAILNPGQTGQGLSGQSFVVS